MKYDWNDFFGVVDRVDGRNECLRKEFSVGTRNVLIMDGWRKNQSTHFDINSTFGVG